MIDDSLKEVQARIGKSAFMKELHRVNERYALFAESLATPLGKEILAQVFERWEGSLKKIMALDATDRDKIEFQVYDDFLAWVNTMIKRYYKLKEKMS
jgi:hypothetical protein